MNIRVNYSGWFSSRFPPALFFSVSLPVEITFSSHSTERDLPMHRKRERSCSSSIGGIFAIRFWIAAIACARLNAELFSGTQTHIYIVTRKQRDKRGLRVRERHGVYSGWGLWGWGENVPSDNYSLLKLHVALLPAGRKAVLVQIERHRRVYNLHVTNSLPCRFRGVD